MMTFLAPPSMWACALVASVKKPVDSTTMSTPTSPQPMAAGSFSAKILMVGVTDGDRVVRVGDVVGEHAEHRVVLEQVGDGLVVHQVVGGDDLDVGTGRLDGPEEVAADAAEAVDSYANGHVCAAFHLMRGVPQVRGTLGMPPTLDLSETPLHTVRGTGE